MGNTIDEAVAKAIARASAPCVDGGDGWETTAAVLAYQLARQGDARC